MTQKLSPNKDHRKLLDQLVAQGFEVSKRGRHVKVRNPQLKKDAIVFIPSTPRGGHVTRRNIITVLKKIGYDPTPKFIDTAKILDYRRLGKQRVETWQVLLALGGKSKGWVNHPAVRMWVRILPSHLRHGHV